MHFLNKTLLVLSFFATASSLLAQSISFPLPTGRSQMAGAYADGKLYFAGGYTQLFPPEDIVTDTIDIYDIATDSWEGEHLSHPRAEMASVVLGTKIYFIGGSDASQRTDRVDIYDYVTHTWTTSTLPTEVTAGTAVAINGKIYLVRGYAYDYPIFIYDPTTQVWSTLSMPNPSVVYPGATAVGNYLVVAGGETSSTGPISEIHTYNTVTHQWKLAQMTSKSNLVSAESANGKAYLVGGLFANGSPALNIYDPVQNTVKSVFVGSSPYNKPALAVYDNRLLISGGNTDRLAQFNLITEEIPFSSSYAQPKEYQTVVTAPNSIYFGGGLSSGNITDRVYPVTPMVLDVHNPIAGVLEFTPNPVQDVLTLSIPSDLISSAPIGITVNDLLGRQIMQLQPEMHEETTSIDVSQLAPGIYQILLSNAGQSYVNKFVKK